MIDNAIRYSPPSSTVTVRCYSEDSFGVFSVEDSGPGIPYSERDSVFNRYYRIDTENEGSGLGLAIVKDIAKNHNARIVLKDGSGGKGMILSVYFPGNPPLNS